MSEPVEIQLRLEGPQYQYVMDIARASGVQPDSVVAVILAMFVAKEKAR